MIKSNLIKSLLCFSLLAILSFSCTEKKLPILGPRTLKGSDTIYAQVPEFEFVDQNNSLIRLSEISKNIHVATFFFTSCPTICPKVMRNISRISDHFKNQTNISYLCFSLDYKRDSVARLIEYYTKVGFDDPKLHLLRGNQPNDIKSLAEHYLSTAVDDPTAPGGINHSGWILLVDKKKQLRSYCLGTDDIDVDRFIEDIELLMHEK
ncbi:MAG: SCO family protein [Saprospiraceae bacterium]